MDISEVTESRYQPTRTKRAIYSIGDAYYAVGGTAPQDRVGSDWRQHHDQFWALRHRTVLWVSAVVANNETTP
jgi:hypothetical protein